MERQSRIRSHARSQKSRESRTETLKKHYMLYYAGKLLTLLSQHPKQTTLEKQISTWTTRSLRKQLLGRARTVWPPVWGCVRDDQQNQKACHTIPCRLPRPRRYSIYTRSSRPSYTGLDCIRRSVRRPTRRPRQRHTLPHFSIRSNGDS
jgi:hypothetical protein